MNITRDSRWFQCLAGIVVLGSLNIAVVFAAPAHPQATHDPGCSCGSRYGGPTYEGPPNLNIAASLSAAGGNSSGFSSSAALISMVGVKRAHAEIIKLRKQYGNARIDSWLTVFNFVVNDSLEIASGAGIQLPRAQLKGKALAATMVKSGVQGQTFYIEFMLDKIVSHRIHERVMDDIDSRYGLTANADYHRISNQAFYDLSQALQIENVHLPAFH